MERSEDEWRKGPWTAQEDKLLIDHVNSYGEGRWNSLAELTGLKRSGKSCRLRWVNYLRPDLKKGKITPEEENTIKELHGLWGNRWSTIARRLPGRTDNEIKNFWRTRFKKRNPSKNIDRARARFLKHQQEQEQEQKIKQEELMHEYEQQQQAMRMSLSQNATTCSYPFKHPFDYSLLHDGSNCASGTSDCSVMVAAAMEDVGLWNLDGFTAVLFDQELVNLS